MNCALLVVDMQNDFVLPQGAACVPGALSTVPVVASLIAHARASGWPVIHIIRSHKADGGDAEVFRRQAFQNGQGICVENTFGARIVQELAPLPGERVLVKTRFSAFYQTGLEQHLRESRIGNLLIAGTQYPNCLRGTAMDALYRDFGVSLITDACSAATDEVARANIYDLRHMGVACISLAELKSAGQACQS